MKSNIHAHSYCLVVVMSKHKYSTYFLTSVSSVPAEHTKSNLTVTSPEDGEHVSRRQASPNGTAHPRGDAKGSRTVPRRHTLGGARGSREILAMQPSDMDKKREAFLEHLKQKYPHHASAIMGHQERLREQVSGLKKDRACTFCMKIGNNPLLLISNECNQRCSELFPLAVPDWITSASFRIIWIDLICNLVAVSWQML